MRTVRIVYIASAALHLALGSAVASVRRPPVRESVAVTMREVRRPRRPATPPPPPPPTPDPVPTAPAAAARPAAAPRPSNHRARGHAPAGLVAGGGASSDAPDFGLALGNEGGEAPAGPASDAAPAPASAPVEAPRARADECAEEATRPRVIEMPEPEYPEAARDEGIEGRVRVELSLDEEGHVVRARVLAGLGHGLDEAALTAARGARFEPATRCGRAVATTFTVAMRFTL